MNTEQVEKIKEEICRRYCRFPEAYPESDLDRMKEEKCSKCPLNEVVK